MKKILWLLLVSVTANAQLSLPVPLNLKKTYEKQTRSTDGKPGKNYWQNKATYTIDINYDPATRLLTGKEEISYTNNSPDVLNRIVFKLNPNLYKKGAARDVEIDPADLTNGMAIEKLVVDGMDRLNQTEIKGTNMQVTGVTLLPGQTIHFLIHYYYTENKNSHIRTGEIEPGAAFIAYSFPRIAVYDDMDGWNEQPYTGSREFYNDFCQFNVSVTVPGNYLVWATGDLQNASGVLAEKYLNRLRSAEQKDEIVFIVDQQDLEKGNITRQNSSNTWKFSADNVTDFAFAVSDHYVWKSTSIISDKKTGRRTRIDAVFNPAHKNYVEVIDFSRKTIALMNEVFPKWPFPYNHFTVVDGLDQMEYPMMANDNPVAVRADAITLTIHEIFHTMFPFYMGTNETKHAWMDEGWATLAEWLMGSMIDSTLVDEYGIDRTEKYAGTETDMPIVSLSTQQAGTSYFINAYPKPAYGYLFVKDMLGEELFTKALHYYIQQWNGKHPMPLDFFNCMNTGSGKNLNWFWKRWFYDNGYPDLAINKVTETGNNKQVLIESIGSKPVPVDITVFYTDGTKQTLHRSIAVWEKNNKTVSLNFSSAKKISKVELGSLYVPDVNKKDNVWKRN